MLNRQVLSTALAFVILSAAVPAHADDESAYRWYLQGGGYVHYRSDDDYDGPPLFASLEYLPSSRWVYGVALFQNSFGQFSQYAYAGRLFRPWREHPEYHFKLTAGLVHGYKEPHHDTLPLRFGDSAGIGIVPTLGYRKGRVGYDIAFLKASAMLFLVGYHFE